VALPALIRALGGDAAGVRSAVASALAEIGASASVPALVRSLSDRNVHVRRAAAEAIADIRRARGESSPTRGLYEAVVRHSQDTGAGGESSTDQLVRQANDASDREAWDAAIGFNRQLLGLAGSSPPEVLVHNLAFGLVHRGIRDHNRAIEILNQEAERQSGEASRRRLAESLDEVAMDGSLIGRLRSSCHGDLGLFWGALAELVRVGGDTMASHNICMCCNRRRWFWSPPLRRIEASGGACLVLCRHCHQALGALQPGLPEEAVSLLDSAAQDIMEAAELDTSNERIQQCLQKISATLSNSGLSMPKHHRR